MAGEPGQRGLAELGRREVEPPPDAGQGRAGEGRHVLRALAQGRDLDARDGDPEVEIRPEASARHLAMQVTARRYDHPGAHRERFAAADALEAAILEHVQQRRLVRRLELPDLVEEERPLPGALEAAGPPRQRPGEGAPLVPEQLILEERTRQRGTVRVHEAIPPPGGQLVEQTGRDALPHPRLPGHEHRRVEGRQRGQLPADRARRRALADHLPHGVVNR